VVLDALRPYDSRVEDHPERPFVFTHGPSDPTGYLLQRRVVEHILATPQPDRLFVEETMIGVLSRAIENTCNRHRPGRQADRAHRELVRVVQTLLVTRFHEHLTIERIADAVHYSPYHLCRVFRQHTGMTIHQYLNQVRLRTALEMIADGGADLTEVALDLCYSSHSHFTQAFRRAFGVPPSRMKAIPVAQNLRQMSKISIA
jgi:AraC-like DNA-binding protein